LTIPVKYGIFFNGNIEKQYIFKENSVDKKQHSASPSSSQALAPLERYALVPTNPTVVSLSRAFKWNPETVIARVQRALPVQFEQQIYLAVAESFRIHPESLAKLLLIYRGSKPLSITDLERRELGKNVVSNSFGDFSDFFEACMHLVKIVSKEYEAFGLSMDLAAHIVLTFGVNHPEALIEMIDTNLEECCDFFGISRHQPYSLQMRLCVWCYITKLLPLLREAGIPDVLDPTEFMGHERFRQKCFNQALGNDELEEAVPIEKIRELLRGGNLL
jgi:hypothetical protein